MSAIRMLCCASRWCIHVSKLEHIVERARLRLNGCVYVSFKHVGLPGRK